jgi:hypothetical protein
MTFQEIENHVDGSISCSASSGLITEFRERMIFERFLNGAFES